MRQSLTAGRHWPTALRLPRWMPRRPACPGAAARAQRRCRAGGARRPLVDRGAGAHCRPTRGPACWRSPSMRCASWAAATELRERWRPRHRRRGSTRLLCLSLALLWPADAAALRRAHAGRPGRAGRAATRGPAAAGFVNAVLRRFLRERDDAGRRGTALSPWRAYNHPLWWIERVRQRLAGQWRALLMPPTSSRRWCCASTRAACSGADYVQRLARRASTRCCCTTRHLVTG